MHVDGSVLITGDSRGLISVRQVKDGKMIQNLNVIEEEEEDKSEELVFQLEKRINFIKRIGRLVWIGTESARIKVCFYFIVYK